MTNLDSIFKSRDITLPTKVHLVNLIGEKGVAARCRGGKRDGFGAQVGQGCVKSDFDRSKLAAVEEFAHGQ